MALTCPYCARAVEPLVAPDGTRVCPLCSNRGPQAAPAAPLGPTVHAAPGAWGQQQAMVGLAPPQAVPYAPEAAFAAGYHAAMLHGGSLVELQKRSKHATQEGILAIVLGPLGLLLGFLGLIGIACGITGLVRSSNLLRETANGMAPHIQAAAAKSRTTSIVGLALSVAGTLGNVALLVLL